MSRKVAEVQTFSGEDDYDRIVALQTLLERLLDVTPVPIDQRICRREECRHPLVICGNPWLKKTVKQEERYNLHPGYTFGLCWVMYTKSKG